MSASQAVSRSEKTTKFIERSQNIFGQLYLYDSIVYTKSCEHLTLSCRAHGEFKVTPANHLNKKSGCRKCGSIRTSEKTKSNTTDFIRKCHLKYGNRYDYSKTEYSSSAKKLIVGCYLHGDFSITANSHLSGHGCSLCAFSTNSLSSKMTTEEFTRRAISVHGNTYNYKCTLYEGNKINLTIVCHEHGEFMQRADHHLSGSGCSRCAKSGYSESIAGHLYVLSNGDVTKIGITNRNVQVRATEISRSSGSIFNILYSKVFENGEIPKDIESSLLGYFRMSHKQPTETYDGSTECFYGIDLTDLTNRIIKLEEEFGYAL